MPLPISLEATQTLAATFSTLIESNGVEIFTLLLTSFFYFQLWHIPLTWVFALLCGTCMPTIVHSAGATHLLNIAAVACNNYLSLMFLKKCIRGSERMRAHLQQMEEQVSLLGPD